MCISGIVGAGTALLGASGASSAADAQVAASEAQVDLSREIYYDQKETLAPYLGNNLAIQALMYENGLGAAPTFGGTNGPTPQRVQVGTETNGQREWIWTGSDAGGGYYSEPEETPIYKWDVNGRQFDTQDGATAFASTLATDGETFGGFTESPGYQFRLDEGLDAVQSGVGAQHGLNSGATLQALTQYGQDYGSNEYNNYYNRLAGLAAGNQAAAAGQVSAGSEYVSNANNALANIGNAQAAGSIGVTNAITGGINNGVGLWAYGQQNGF
ncbi:MAG: hypothetical protein ABJ360_22540 [Roseobacter sp.]